MKSWKTGYVIIFTLTCAIISICTDVSTYSDAYHGHYLKSELNNMSNKELCETYGKEMVNPESIIPLAVLRDEVGFRKENNLINPQECQSWAVEVINLN